MTSLATRDTWTTEQTEAVHNTRALFAGFQLPLGSARTASERAALPAEGVPEGVHLDSELIPASTNVPKAILDGRVHPDEVPIFFYSTTKDVKVESTPVVLFFHGGGNIAGHPTDFQFLPALAGFTQKLGGTVVAAPSYRCATVPENSFPANLQDAFAAYEYLLKKGYKPEHITVAGDSSGGNLGKLDL
jgi:acetyl esterase/lipase